MAVLFGYNSKINELQGLLSIVGDMISEQEITRQITSDVPIQELFQEEIYKQILESFYYSKRDEEYKYDLIVDLALVQDVRVISITLRNSEQVSYLAYVPEYDLLMVDTNSFDITSQQLINEYDETYIEYLKPETREISNPIEMSNDLFKELKDYLLLD